MCTVLIEYSINTHIYGDIVIDYSKTYCSRTMQVWGLNSYKKQLQSGSEASWVY